MRSARRSIRSTCRTDDPRLAAQRLPTHSCHTGESRYPWQIWIPTCVGMTRRGFRTEDPMDGTTELLESDRRFLVHPLHHPEEHKAPLLVDEGRGAMLHLADGRRVIDGLGGLWNVNVGHGRGELADAAAGQMRKIAYASSYVGMTNAPALHLAEKIRGHAYPSRSGVDYT